MVNKLSDAKSNSFPFQAELFLTIHSKKELLTIYKAIKPETTVEISTRGKTEILIDSDTKLRLLFYAADFISLRAQLGSFLRWLDVAIQSIDALSQ